jgi:orotate phosphoribosyltransferase
MKNRIDNPIYIPITKIIDENPNVKTFYFEYNLNSKPGQFIMLWIPGIDQKPFSIRHNDENSFSITVFKIGNLTEKLFNMNVGDRVGISGPYGNPFSIVENAHYIIVAGGYGASPLANLSENVVQKNSTVDFLLGAKNKNLLLFQDALLKIKNINLLISTDDGSEGQRGYVTDELENIINKNTYKRIIVCTCGPEIMEKKVLDICNKLNTYCEISIERYMKCGFGVCGQCCVDEIGIPMCNSGPVVSRELANKIFEFGKYSRDKSGKIADNTINMNKNIQNLTISLYNIGAIKFGEFKLKSGIMSPIYIDLRLIVSYPNILKKVAEAMWEKIKNLDFELICGVPYTALPIATAISILYEKPMIMRRKEIKEYGTKKIIEGFFTENQKCLVVEDLITSGSSILETTEPLEKEGLNVKDIIVLIDREQGGKNIMKEKGYNIYSVITISEMLEILKDANKLDTQTVEKVKNFIKQNQI